MAIAMRLDPALDWPRSGRAMRDAPEALVTETAGDVVPGRSPRAIASSPVIANARILNAPLTGVQRYASELLARMPSVAAIKPAPLFRSAAGHLWEQAVLPFQLNGGLLWSPAGVGPLAVTRQVVTVHDLATIDCPQDYTPAYRAYYQWLLPRLLPRVAGIIAVSEFSRRRVVEQFRIPADRVHAIPNGVDHAHFHPRAESEVAALRARLGLPSRYVLYLGTISVRKNLACLLDAWRVAQDRVDPETVLVVAGGVGLSRVFGATGLPDLPPRTMATGRIAGDDLPALLTGASAFVFPSLYEGFGLPPLEAMACGTPAIVSDATSLPEVVGEAALRFDPRKADELAARLIDLLNSSSLQATCREKGLKRAAAFDWDRTAERTWDVLSAL
jgi:glycosyltransferase involved in cell wall biosynthesis